MSFGPEKKPTPGVVIEENPRRERGEHEIVAEAGGAFENIKAAAAIKGVLAVTRGILWLEWHGLDPFGADNMSKEDKEKVKEQGWIKTAWGKTVEAYGGLGKAEEFINENILKDRTIEDILDGPEAAKHS